MQPLNPILSFSIFLHIHNGLRNLGEKDCKEDSMHHKTALMFILYALKHLCCPLMFANDH